MRTKDAETSGRRDAVSLLAGAGCKHFPGVDRNQQELHFFQAKVDRILPVHNAKKYKTNVLVIHLHFGQEGVDVRHGGVEHVRGQVIPHLGEGGVREGEREGEDG